MASDTERLDWLEENLDDVLVKRDVTAGVSFELTYCSDESGCALEKSRSTFREAIDAAMQEAAHDPKG